MTSHNESATDNTTRFEDNLDLTDATEGDRIDPAIIPRSPEIEVGEQVARHLATPNDPQNDDDDRTFDVRLIAHGSDSSDDVQSALVYDPDAGLFARISGHTNSGAWNQKERDYKVRDIGHDIEIVDQWNVEIPDLDEFGETEAEFVAEWAEILFDNIRYGDTAGEEIDQFDGKEFQLRDFDGRRAHIKYELVTEQNE